MSNSEIRFRSQYEQKEAIVFCVELTNTMYQPKEELDNKTPLREILESIDYIMAKQAISLPNTAVGCYFFNSTTTSTNCEKGMYQYFRLQRLNTKVMKQVRDMLNDTDDKNGLAKPLVTLQEAIPMIKFTAQEEFNKNRTYLNNVLIQMKKEFIFNASNNKKYNYKRIFLITDNDKPFNAQTTEGQSMKKNIRLLFDDLDNAKVNITPFFLNGDNLHKFDNSLYSEVLYFDNGDSHFVNQDGSYEVGKNMDAISIKDIRKKVDSRKEIHRMQFQCPLDIAPGLTIAVKGYSMFSNVVPKSASAVYTKSETPKPVLSRTKYFAATSSRAITEPKSELIRAFRFGDDAIRLTPEQLRSVRAFEEDHDPDNFKLKIIGFRKTHRAFKHQYHLKNSEFIYVNNAGNYTNAFRAFSCLYQSCKELDRAAIVWGSTRLGSHSSLYALVPSRYQALEQKNLALKFPQGFFLVHLPSTDNIRAFPAKVEAVPVSDELTTIAKQFLKSFDLAKGYVPSEYKNPTLQWHYRVLRDDALLEEVARGQYDKIESLNDEQLKSYVEFDETLVKVAKIRKLIQNAKAVMEQAEVKGEEEPSAELIKQTKRLHLVRAFNSQLNMLTGKKHIPSKRVNVGV